MHMADALISPAVGLGFYGASAGLLAWAARKTSREPDYERKLPLMGVLGAFVFAAQMINFSIPGTGSSGHLGGGLLLAVLLGPYAAFLVIASVLVVQCLFFMDGGLLALGCNIFNLGFWPAFVGLPLYALVARGRNSPGVVLGASLAAVAASLELGAFSVVVQTVLSSRSELPFPQFAATMLAIHAPIAIVEGIVTAAVVQFVRRLLPETVTTRLTIVSVSVTPLAVLTAVALAVGTVLAWFASSHPDGLEWTIARVSGHEELPAAEQGLARRLQSVQERTAIMPDYAFPAAAGEADAGEAQPAWPAVDAGTSAAGLVGSLLTGVLILALGVALWAVRRRDTQPERQPA